jgi:hypothetical protein
MCPYALRIQRDAEEGFFSSRGRFNPLRSERIHRDYRWFVPAGLDLVAPSEDYRLGPRLNSTRIIRSGRGRSRVMCTRAVIVEAPVNGTDAAHVRFSAWQFRQILGRGAHGNLLCQAEAADAVHAFLANPAAIRIPRPGLTRARPRWSSGSTAPPERQPPAGSASEPAAVARK